MYGEDVLSRIFAEAEQEVASPAEEEHELEFHVDRSLLRGLLEKALYVVPAKGEPIHKSVHISVSDSELILSASGLHQSYVSEIPVEAIQEGAVLFPARRLFDIVSEAPEGIVRVHAKGDRARVEVGRSSWDLRLPTSRGFPSIPDREGVELVDVDRDEFLQGLIAVRYAASRDFTYPNRMLIDVQNGRMTACDGARLQRVVTDIDQSWQLPVSAADEIIKLFKTGDLQVGQNDDNIFFVSGADVFIVHKLQVEFPEVESLFVNPALQYTSVLTCDCGELIDAIRQVRITADSDTAAVGLLLTRNSLELLTRDRFNNSASVKINASWQEVDRMVVVNHGYLTDMLRMYEPTQCKFYVGPDRVRRSALVLRDDERGFLAICQQMSSHLVGK